MFRDARTPPRISIAIATYNRGHLLGRTLESLLAQTFDDFELILSDDASADATPDVCARFAAADPRVRYVRNDTRLGLGGNCSRVLAMTAGEFVVLAGDDDVYHARFLERLLAVMVRYPSVAVAACGIDMIDHDGRVVRRMNQHFAAEPLSSGLRTANRMLWRGYGNLMTGMYRRTVMEQTLLYRPVRADEWDEIDMLFLFEMALRGDVVSIPDVLLYKRTGGVSAQIPYRNVAAALVVWWAAGRGYATRIARCGLPAWQKAVLHASLSVRWTLGNWQWQRYVAYTLLVTIDRRRLLRRPLRRLYEMRRMRKPG